MYTNLATGIFAALISTICIVMVFRLIKSMYSYNNNIEEYTYKPPDILLLDYDLELKQHKILRHKYEAMDYVDKITNKIEALINREIKSRVKYVENKETGELEAEITKKMAEEVIKEFAEKYTLIDLVLKNDR